MFSPDHKAIGLPYAITMRVKQDANPGMLTPAWFSPTRPGEYDVVCSQLCGLAHFRMRAILRVVDDAEFRRWLAAQAAPQGSQGS